MIDFVQAATSEQIEAARRLFRAYEASLNLDLNYQNFEKELAELPGKYAAPEGCLLLAVEDEKVLGCVAMRKLEIGVCEMKRLFVLPAAQGKGLGKNLVKEIIKCAKNAGYHTMKLDTLASRMQNAIQLYRAFGFQETAAYYQTPMADTIFMELNLPNN